MIPLFAPVRQNEAFFPELSKAFDEILKSGEYVLGKKVDAFEAQLSHSLNFKHAIGCASGTEALVLALKALNLPAGSKVLTPAFSFVASSSSISWAGHTPAFIDVDLNTYCISLEDLEKAYTPDVRAVIAVDLYGQQPDFKKIREFCALKKLPLIEDGAQSIGVPNQGVTFYTTSFYPTKNIGAIGDAGAVLTDNSELATRVKELSRHGSLVRDHYPFAGTTGRLDTLQAAILNIKLPHMQKWTQKRTEIANFYLESLKGLEDKCILPVAKENHVWSLFTLRIPNHRNKIAEMLREKGVGAGIYYSKAICCQPAFGEKQHCPKSEQLAQEVLSIPIYPELSPLEINQICDTLRACLTSI